MTQELWDAVDDFFVKRLSPAEPVFDQILERSAAAGLPPIHVSASGGKLLQLLVAISQARSILEVGTLAGYSTVWMARALPPGGRIVTLEVDPKHVEVARANFAQAGVEGVIELRPGAALDTLPEVEKAGLGPFDMAFIDADKANIPDYFDWAVRLSRTGSIVVIDNVVREGAILDESSSDPSVQGVRRLADQLANDVRVSATAVQTVGAKGHDGFVLATVN